MLNTAAKLVLTAVRMNRTLLCETLGNIDHGWISQGYLIKLRFRIYIAKVTRDTVDPLILDHSIL